MTSIDVDVINECSLFVFQALLSGCHGNRPVTLVGYSFGARVIFSCLRTLAAQMLPKEEIEDDNRDTVSAFDNTDANNSNNNVEVESAKDDSLTIKSGKSKISIDSLVQDVVLLGAPINAKSRVWKAIRKLVVGRVVNGYAPNDLVLGVVYR